MNVPRVSSVVVATLFLILVQPSPTRGQGSNPDSLLSAALAMSRKGDADGARRLAQLIVAAHPRYHDARLLLARTLAWSGALEEALRHVDTILTDQPRHRDARLFKATVLSWQKEYMPAIKTLSDLVAEEGETADVAAELGKVYLWNRDPRMSYHWYRIAYEKDSLSADAVRGLARASLMMGQNETSLNWYRRLLQLAPSDGEAHASVERLEYHAAHEILLQGSLESFSKPGIRSHNFFGVEYYHGVFEQIKPFLHLSTVSKFGASAHRIGGGMYWSPGYATGVMTQVIAAPGSSVVARWDALGEVNYFVGSGFELIGAYRFLSFARTDVHIVSPGVTWYASDNLWGTLRVYVSSGSSGSSSQTGVAIVVFKPDGITTMRLIASAGSEVQEATLAQQEIAQHPTTLTVSVRRRFIQSLALGMSYQYSSRLPSSSHTVLVTTSLYF